MHAESPDQPLEQVDARTPAIHEQQAQIGAGGGDHETGCAAATAEVDHGAAHGGEGGEEPTGMGDDGVNVSRSERPETLGDAQRLGEITMGQDASAIPTGVTMTRR